MKTSNLLRSPSFLKGMARTVDILADLDRYQNSKNADTQTLNQDWRAVGRDFTQTIATYVKKSSR